MNTEAQAEKVEKVQKIRDLNDRFRKGDRQLGIIVATPMVQGLGLRDKYKLFDAIRDFDGFSQDNDPYGEHDFGSVEISNENYFWSISYMDTNLEYGSEDPSDPTVTKRVLTIMHSLEY